MANSEDLSTNNTRESFIQVLAKERSSIHHVVDNMFPIIKNEIPGWVIVSKIRVFGLQGCQDETIYVNTTSIGLTEKHDHVEKAPMG